MKTSNRSIARGLLALVVLLAASTVVVAKPGGAMHLKTLTPTEAAVIEGKATERPFTGRYYLFDEPGTYTCKRCGAPLFSSDSKFDAGCGWPSFDQTLTGAVREVPDADGQRTEIVCARCGAHLGHVFRGEHYTPNDTRHCVNSISLEFDPQGSSESATAAEPAAGDEPAVAYVAGGCFWGVEYYLEQLPGVLAAESGYMGGTTRNPTYEEVSSHRTGHLETVKVTYDPARVSYEQVAKRFFEIHDPTQADGQGPDVGPQYRSAIFVNDATERATIQALIRTLRSRGYDVATRLEDATTHPFWPAEAYHQNFLLRTQREPECHVRVNRFGD